jgi:hypothetical protein
VCPTVQCNPVVIILRGPYGLILRGTFAGVQSQVHQSWQELRCKLRHEHAIAHVLFPAEERTAQCVPHLLQVLLRPTSLIIAAEFQVHKEVLDLESS